MKQNNGNSQLNEARESINRRTGKYRILSNSRRSVWQSKRRFRTI